MSRYEQSKSSVTILEGFLCPMCQLDCSSIDQLQEHFYSVHNQPKNESSASSLTNPDRDDRYNASLCVSSYKEFFGSNQAKGHSVSLLSDFKLARENSIGRMVIQTNKLLTILDRLISPGSDVLKDPIKRETHFKSVVPWLPQESVNLCPTCGSSFNFVIRRHHCRLCGSIMCKSCSNFVTYQYAKQLTIPNYGKTKLALMNGETSTKGSERAESKTEAEMSKISIRACSYCFKFLEKKYRLLKKVNSEQIFLDIYDELSKHINEIKRIMDIACKLVESENSKKTITEQRAKMAHHLEQAESLCEKLTKYTITDENNRVVVKNDQAKLQRNLRIFTINFLKEKSFMMTSLYAKFEQNAGS